MKTHTHTHTLLHDNMHVHKLSPSNTPTMHRLLLSLYLDHFFLDVEAPAIDLHLHLAES